MTLEELEIVVTAKVDDAINNIKKIIPSVNKAIEECNKSIESINVEPIAKETQKQVGRIKTLFDKTLKSLNNKDKINIKVANDEAITQIKQIEREISALQKQISQREIELNINTSKLDELKYKTKANLQDIFPNTNQNSLNTLTQNSLNNDKDYNKLLKQNEKIIYDIEVKDEQLEIAKQKLEELKSKVKEVGKTEVNFNSVQNGANTVGTNVKNVKAGVNKITQAISMIQAGLGKISGAFENVKKKVVNINGQLSSSLKNVLKYAAALFSIRSIYSLLSSSASNWLSSQNAGAEQLKANIDYLKSAMGSALAPIIIYITNLVYNLLKAIQTLVYALFNVNIFAKASASSYGSMASSAKKAATETKQLAGVHSEINNIQSSDSSGGGSGGGGGASPSFDLSSVDGEISAFSQKLIDFFKPLKESWDIYGRFLIEQVKTTAEQVTGFIRSVWKSFENIITNGTVYTSLELILRIIGNIADAFTNAWKKNENGNKIVQNLANAFNHLLIAIQNLTASDEFQEFCNYVVEKFEGMSETIAQIDWETIIDAIFEVGKAFATIALGSLEFLLNFFQWLSEHPAIADIFISVALAIRLISGAIKVLTPIILILIGVIGLCVSGCGWLVVAIVAVIAIISAVIYAILNWDEICTFMVGVWEWVKTKAQEIWNWICEKISTIMEKIKTTIEEKWNKIKDFFSRIGETLGTIAKGAWDFISEIIGSRISNAKETIETVFGGIKRIFNGIIEFVSGVFSGNWRQAWQGIVDVFSRIFNSITGVGKGVINGIIDPINAFIKGVNKITIPDWVPRAGGKNINIPQIPRLAKGGILTQETLFVGGEYSGAKQNPEIVTPQKIMYETIMKANQDSNNSNKTEEFNIQLVLSNKILGEVLIDNLREKKKRTGKNIDALIT